MEADSKGNSKNSNNSKYLRRIDNFKHALKNTNFFNRVIKESHNLGGSKILHYEFKTFVIVRIVM